MFVYIPTNAALQYIMLPAASLLSAMMAFRLMLKAVVDGAAELARTGTQQALLDRMATRAELYEIIDYPAWDAHEQRYVTDVD